MSSDIPNLQIEQNSSQGQKIQMIQHDNVSAEEANCHPQPANCAPGQEMIGLFSSNEDRVLIDEVMEMAVERRKLDEPRDFDV